MYIIHHKLPTLDFLKMYSKETKLFMGHMSNKYTTTLLTQLSTVIIAGQT